MKEFRAELVGGTVGAIEDDAETGEFGSRNHAATKKIEIFSVERGIGHEKRRVFRRRIGTMLEDVGFEDFFNRVRELHACVGEKFYAVVVIRIVRSGNDDAGLKIILADEASHTWSGYDSGKGDRGAGLREASG